MHHRDTKAIIARILERPLGLNWTLQGFGMLRLYFTPNIRLHVWSKAHVTPKVSLMHDHPWHFRSTVIAGQIRNSRYELGIDGPQYWMQKLKCGAGGGLCDEPPVKVRVKMTKFEAFNEGDVYTERADEIHISSFADGSVTLVERDFLSDPHHARVLWPVNTEWVSAEPRRATDEEVQFITENALKRHF